MAVDSAQKRRSMLSFGRMNYGERVPQATDFDSDTDRAQMVFLYAGVSIAPPPGDPVDANDRLRRRRVARHRTKRHGGG